MGGGFNSAAPQTGSHWCVGVIFFLIAFHPSRGYRPVAPVPGTSVPNARLLGRTMGFGLSSVPAKCSTQESPVVSLGPISPTRPCRGRIRSPCTVLSFLHCHAAPPFFYPLTSSNSSHAKCDAGISLGRPVEQPQERLGLLHFPDTHILSMAVLISFRPLSH